MRVGVFGATGAVGRPLVTQLVDAGLQVLAVSRSAPAADEVRPQVHTACLDLLDGDPLPLLEAFEPDVVVHQATSLPKSLTGPVRVASALRRTERLREEGTRRLVHAARTAGVKRVIAQGVAFAYRPGEGPPRSEDDPLYTDAPRNWRSSVEALTSLEGTVLDTPGIEGTVLRYGALYGPGTYYAAGGGMSALVRRRLLPLLSDGDGVYGFLHVDDAAAAAVRSLEGPAGTFNIVDDHPAPTSSWLPAMAQLLGAKPPRRLPGRLLVTGMGGQLRYLLAQQPAVSNRRARDELGWVPAHPDWRCGFKAEIARGVR